MNIIKTIINEANNHPKKTAIVELNESGKEESTYSYSDLLTCSMNIIDKALKDIRDGEHVGIIMGNSPSWVIADLALMFKHVIEVPVPLSFSAEQASNLLSKCRLLLVDQIGLETLNTWKKTDFQFPNERYVVTPENLMSPRYNYFDYPEIVDDKIIKVIHTSGTTSNPKGVCIRSHGLNDLIKVTSVSLVERNR